MVRMGHDDLKDVRFSLPEPGPVIELTSLEGIIRRGGRKEFLPAQRLDFDLLYRVESGTTVHQVDFVSHQLGPGDALWVRAGQVHRWGDISDLSGRVVIFPPHAIAPDTQAILGGLGFGSSFPRKNRWSASELSATGAASAWFSLASEDTLGGNPTARTRLRDAALSALLIRLASAGPSLEPSGTAAGHSSVFRIFRAAVDSHFRTVRAASDYARMLGWSVKTLTRVAAEHGTTPKTVIDDRVVLEAKRLLIHTDASVAQIGAQIGFDDSSNFSSFFRLRTGVTPGAFRTDIGGQQ